MSNLKFELKFFFLGIIDKCSKLSYREEQNQIQFKATNKNSLKTQNSKQHVVPWNHKTQNKGHTNTTTNIEH